LRVPKEQYPKKDDTTITPLHQPGTLPVPLTEIADEGTRQMLAAALRAEGVSFVASLIGERLLWAPREGSIEQTSEVSVHG